MIPRLNAGELLEAMVQVVEDARYRHDIAGRGLVNAKRFSWTRCSHETLAILAEVGSGGRS